MIKFLSNDWTILSDANFKLWFLNGSLAINLWEIRVFYIYKEKESTNVMFSILNVKKENVSLDTTETKSERPTTVELLYLHSIIKTTRMQRFASLVNTYFIHSRKQYIHYMFKVRNCTSILGEIHMFEFDSRENRQTCSALWNIPLPSTAAGFGGVCWHVRLCSSLLLTDWV